MAKMPPSCFVAGTPVLLLRGAVPIQKVKLGDRVRTENNTPSSTSDDEGGGEEPGLSEGAAGEGLERPEESYVAVRFQMLDRPAFHGELLRPESWAGDQALAVGGLLRLEVSEPGFTGFAKILAITPLGCRPPPVAGEVTGRFESVTRRLTTVTFEGAAAPLVGTPAHPIWSRNRQAWTPLARLRPGERVAALAGPARVLRTATRPVPPTPVFNLEVARLHRYPVTSLGLRVHNDCDVNGGGKWTKDVIDRSSRGADGASSRHIIEKLDGKTNSVTHQVTKDGKVIHQHQTHVGKHGTTRQFPDKWVEYPTIPSGGNM